MCSRYMESSVFSMPLSELMAILVATIGGWSGVFCYKKHWKASKNIEKLDKHGQMEKMKNGKWKTWEIEIWKMEKWYHMVPCGTVWYRMVPYGTIWYRMVLYGTIWYHLVPYGTIGFSSSVFCLSSPCLMLGTDHVHLDSVWLQRSLDY